MNKKTDFLKILECAIRAPSGHNTQPWKFKIQENCIEVYPDFAQELPVVDSDHRELYISLGCAVFNICLAASQYGCSYQIEIIEEVEQTSIKIDLNKNQTTKDTLFEQIEKRQTNRNLCTGESIDNDALMQLQKLHHRDDIGIYFFKNNESCFRIIKENILKGNEIQMNNPKFKKELISWIRFNKKEVNKHQNGLSYEVMGSPSIPGFIGKIIIKFFLTSKKQNKLDEEKIDSSSHFVLLTTQSNTVKEWINLGMNLQRLLLKCVELEIATAFCNQPCEIVSLSSKLQKQLPIHNEYPSIILRIGHAKSVPFSPRKDLEEVLV